MAKVTFDYSKAAPFINEDELNLMEAQVAAAKKLLVDRSGAGNDFLGWIDLPVNYDKEEFARIQQAAKKIQEDSEVLVVIGIGGSYLGARAAIEFLRHSFYNMVKYVINHLNMEEKHERKVSINSKGFKQNGKGLFYEYDG